MDRLTAVDKAASLNDRVRALASERGAEFFEVAYAILHAQWSRDGQLLIAEGDLTEMALATTRAMLEVAAMTPSDITAWHRNNAMPAWMVRAVQWNAAQHRRACMSRTRLRAPRGCRHSSSRPRRVGAKSSGGGSSGDDDPHPCSRQRSGGAR